jgi:hypothetical protein
MGPPVMMSLMMRPNGQRRWQHRYFWHAAGQIKGSATLFKFVKVVGRAEAPAFELQENGLQLFLFARRYNDLAMDEYIQHGASFWFYSTLLSAIPQLAFNHLDQPWNKGLAQSMLAFHLDRLLQIRSHALTQKALILQTYCYLRDADPKGFYHELMTESLWSRLAELSTKDSYEGGGGAPPGDGRRSRCSHCQKPKVHNLCHVGPSKPDCPILGVADLAKA